MELNIYLQLEFILRIFIAGICGASIGYERRNRLKEAGIRTHFIVAFTAALIMIISKYRFNDILLLKGVALDPSRITAQIVTGVGFLGAGIIFVRKQSISGLTTAAGIWATSGVGMTIGSGLYFLGIVSTFIILAQIILHRKRSWIKVPKTEEFIIRICDSNEALDFIKDSLKKNNIEIINMRVEKIDIDCIEFEIYVKLPKEYKKIDLIEIFNSCKFIRSIDV